MSSTQMESIWPIGFQQKLSSNIWEWVGYAVCLCGYQLEATSTKLGNEQTVHRPQSDFIRLGMYHVKMYQILVRLQTKVTVPHAVSLDVQGY